MLKTREEALCFTQGKYEKFDYGEELLSCGSLFKETRVGFMNNEL